MRHRELVATAAAIVVLALMIGTAVTWAQARKTRAVTSILHTYINQTYPLVDFNTVEAMAQATNSLSGPIDEATRERALQVFERAINFYNMASELPPVDVESRTIVARSINRLGFARTVLSRFKRTENGPDPVPLHQANADYSRSIALFETLLAEVPSDPKVRHYFAEALGKWGSGWQLGFMNRRDEAAAALPPLGPTLERSHPRGQPGRRLRRSRPGKCGQRARQPLRPGGDGSGPGRNPRRRGKADGSGGRATATGRRFRRAGRAVLGASLPSTTARLGVWTSSR